MPKRKTAPYGSWGSPISSQMLTTSSAFPSELSVDGDDLYWLELRPEEGGRYALCKFNGGKTVDVLPKTFNVRTRVHEYGGGSYFVHDGAVFFSNYADQRVYRQEPGARPVPITREGVRFADYVMDRERKRLIGVSEDHGVRGRAPINSISDISTDGSGSRVLVSGADFYSNPRLDPTQSRLAWLSWNFPNMPWDGTELWTGELRKDGSIGKRRLVAGGPNESIFQPEWSPDGTLYFVSDRTGWWNLYRFAHGKVEALKRTQAEFAEPLWTLRRSKFAFISEKRIACAFTKNGVWLLGDLDTESRRMRRVRIPFTEISYVRTWRGRAVFRAASPKQAPMVVSLDMESGGWKVLRGSKAPKVDLGYISIPRHIEFPTEGGKRAYGQFYRPKNRDYAAPKGERPPLLVTIHGGPTNSAHKQLDLEIQGWTSRGFALLDVDYGGSTGYGREYWKRLEGRWGVVDVDDCVNGALHLAKTGEVDRKRLIIRGGSAGGYTTLAALAFRKVFGAGASYYGVSDIEALAKDTHKFESRYMDKLVGPLPETRKLYRRRSPIYHVERLRAPVIFFQGLEDLVVPPDQTEKMVKSLKSRGVPVAYLPFEGEQHGFRRSKSIRRAFEAELYFYSRIFGFPLPGHVKPVDIANLKVS